MVVILVLSVLGFLVYSNAFHNSFHFDDVPYIVHNLSIRNIHDLHQIFNIEPTRCVAYFTFALNYLWGGLEVSGYHEVSLLIHVATSILVWQFMRLTLNAPAIKKEFPSLCIPWIAFFTAAIFLTHPLQTQAVNYIYQRAVLLAAFFYLASLILFIKANLAWEAKRGMIKGLFFYGGSLGCAVLSMLSKENAVSLPLMVFFYQWFFLKDGKTFHYKRTLPFFLVLLVIPCSWGLLNFSALWGFKKTVEGYSQGFTVGQYALTQFGVIVTYLKLLILPLHQRVEYDFTVAKSLWGVPVLGSILLLSILLGVAVLLRRRLKLLSFGIFWFFITLMPESSFWPNRDLIEEHRLYLPMLGFSVFLTSGLFYLFKGKSASIAIRILFILVAGYGFLTFQRNKIWRDEFTLWDDAVHQSPGNARAYLNRGAAYQAKGDLYHALMDYNMVIGLGPVDAVTLSNRGEIFMATGHFDLALANYNLAIKINPSYTGTYYNRGLLYKIEGKYDLALADFNKVLKSNPQDPVLQGLWAETKALLEAAKKN